MNSLPGLYRTQAHKSGVKWVSDWKKTLKNSIRNDAAKAPNTDYLQAVAQNAERN